MYNYIIIECNKCKKRRQFYGTLSQYYIDALECCDVVDYTIIDYKDWNIYDLLEVYSSELENQNKHSLTSLPYNLTTALINKNILDDKQLNIVIRTIFEMML